MKASICLATKNHAALLRRSLQSIFAQRPPFAFEVVVADDGSDDETAAVCRYFPLIYQRLDPLPVHFPQRARNAAYRLARGEIIIQQSDEVLHVLPDTVQRLAEELRGGEFLIATVYNWDAGTGQIKECYTGADNRRPFFFLGSLWRKDLFAVGGYDLDFVTPGYDDNWHADCLIHGRGLECRFVSVLGLHQHHARPPHDFGPSDVLYRRKREAACSGRAAWCSSGGPWQ